MVSVSTPLPGGSVERYSYKEHKSLAHQNRKGFIIGYRSFAEMLGGLREQTLGWDSRTIPKATPNDWATKKLPLCPSSGSYVSDWKAAGVVLAAKPQSATYTREATSAKSGSVVRPSGSRTRLPLAWNWTYNWEATIIIPASKTNAPSSASPPLNGVQVSLNPQRQAKALSYPGPLAMGVSWKPLTLVFCPLKYRMAL